MLGFKQFNECFWVKRKKARRVDFLTSGDSNYSCDGTVYEPFKMKRSNKNGQWVNSSRDRKLKNTT